MTRFNLYKIRKIPWLAEELSASKQGLPSSYIRGGIVFKDPALPLLEYRLCSLISSVLVSAHFLPPSFRQTLADPNVSGATASRWINDTTDAILRGRILISSPVNCRRHLAQSALCLVRSKKIAIKIQKVSRCSHTVNILVYHLSHDNEHTKVQWLLYIPLT